MPNSAYEPRTMSELDHVRIHGLIRRQQPPQAAQITEIIDSAHLVRPQDIPADVVTMYSQARVADVDSGEQRTLTVVYPQDADAARGMISVLSPVGASLLGLPVGAVARWTGPDGTRVATRVEAILFQPEASGDHLR
ncbi:MAG: Regulator of nucleoside diphosphate kinase [Burkholderiaceae bacterium]|jgi:regulator of nucleoside diphosphate kinase|nr:MAG: Regulator of nucleoside diphosphate kinase [Burkholderiaceae bacterium]